MIKEYLSIHPIDWGRVIFELTLAVFCICIGYNLAIKNVRAKIRKTIEKLKEESNGRNRPE